MVKNSGGGKPEFSPAVFGVSFSSVLQDCASELEQSSADRGSSGV